MQSIESNGHWDVTTFDSIEAIEDLYQVLCSPPGTRYFVLYQVLIGTSYIKLTGLII